MRLRAISFAAIVVCHALVARADETWRLDNTKAAAGHAITVVGAPQIVADGDAKAVRFDGAHDGLFVSAIPTAGARAFTIEVLFRPAEGGAEAQRFFHVQDTTGRRALLEIRTNGKGGWWLDAFLRTAADPRDRGLTLIDPKQVHPTGRWYWVAMRYDGKRLANFVDGVRQEEGTKDFDALGEGRISIGVRQNLLYWFKGDIREIRFHRQALPAAQLQRTP